MPIGVIDRFEIVNVQHQEGQTPAIALHRHHKDLDEVSAIANSCEGIGGGLLAQLRFHRLADRHFALQFLVEALLLNQHVKFLATHPVKGDVVVGAI